MVAWIDEQGVATSKWKRKKKKFPIVIDGPEDDDPRVPVQEPLRVWNPPARDLWKSGQPIPNPNIGDVIGPVLNAGIALGKRTLPEFARPSVDKAVDWTTGTALPWAQKNVIEPMSGNVVTGVERALTPFTEGYWEKQQRLGREKGLSNWQSSAEAWRNTKLPFGVKGVVESTVGDPANWLPGVGWVDYTKAAAKVKQAAPVVGEALQGIAEQGGRSVKDPFAQELGFAAGKAKKPASIPTMITRDMEAKLKLQGLAQSEIDNLTPQQAWDILESPKPTVGQTVPPSVPKAEVDVPKSVETPKPVETPPRPAVELVKATKVADWQVPTVQKLSRELKSAKGEPGITIEDSYIPAFDTYNPNNKMIVARNASGDPVGVMSIFLTDGVPDLVSVAVTPGKATSGLGEQLARYAVENGYDLRKAVASNENAYTGSGAKFTNRLLSKDVRAVEPVTSQAPAPAASGGTPVEPRIPKNTMSSSPEPLTGKRGGDYVPPRAPVTGDVPPAGAATGKTLWLPEPPRTGAYMESARKEVAGSFKKKVGALDIVEQARQQVLKSRDLGENALNYVSSYIRKAGDLTNEFGLGADGLVTKVRNPSNRSLAINDVLSNPTHYDLTVKQREIALRHGFVYQEALKLAKSYGVDIKELGGADEFWQYIARKVKTKVDPITGQVIAPPVSPGGFRMGAKISAQKERVFDEMLQGLDEGYLYAHPEEALAQHIKGIYRLIGNKQAEDTVRAVTREITGNAPLVFGERRIGQPALQQRASATEIANAIDKIFTPEQEMKALRVAADVSGVIVGQVAALDVSAPFIQGLTVLGHDLKMGLKGKPTSIWAKAYGHMWKAAVNPEAINKFRTTQHDLYKRAMEAGVMTGQSEFTSGIPLAGRALGKIPVVGKTLKEAYKQTWGRMGASYSDFLEVSRIKLFEQMEGAWVRQGGNIYDLGAVINRMTGATSAAARGVGANRRLLERSAAFAPNYLRSSLLLLKDMGGRGATAKEVQSTIAAMLGIGFAVYFAEEKVRGRDPKIKPWPKRLGGDGAEAFTTELWGQRVGLGSWMYGMIKTASEVGAIAVDDPSALVVWNNDHPLQRFIKSKGGPGVQLATELATGKNFWGKPFDSYGDYLTLLVEQLMPIGAQSLLEKPTPAMTESVGKKLAPIALSLTGARTFPYSLTSQWTDEGVFKEYNAIPIKDIEREKQGIRETRTTYRMRNPEVDAKLFMSGQVAALESPSAVDSVLKLAEENKIDLTTIKAISDRMKETAEREKAGLRPDSRSYIDMLIEQLGQPTIPKVVPPITTPAPTYWKRKTGVK